MAKKVKFTIEEVKQIFKDAGCELLSQEYLNNKSPLEYLCCCGNISKINLDRFKRGGRCKECGIKERADNRRQNIKSVRKIFEDGGCVLLSKEYINDDTPLEYICNCGIISTIRLSGFKQGSRCKECGIKKRADNRRTDIEYIRRIFDVAGCVLLSTEYVNDDTKLDYICSCGSISNIRLSDFKNGSRCWKCRNKKIAENKRHDIEYIRRIFVDGGCVLLSKEYVNSKTPLKYICNCGNISKITLHHFKNGERCRDCGIKKRSGENSPSWNPLLSDEDRELGRNFPEYKDWRLSVYQRDNFTCVCCGNRGVNLNAHHLDGYSWCVERRTDVTNGVTLCSTCHKDFHSIYGTRNNTEAQYNDWIQNKRKQDA